MKSFQIPMLSMSLLGLGLLSGLDAPPAHADFIFGAPMNLGPVINSPAPEGGPSISANGLSLFFHSERSGGYGDRDIWVARRATTSEGWTTVENVGPPVNMSYREGYPDISIDGLTLFFSSDDRPGGLGGSDLWVTTRATESAPWGTPVNLGPIVNSTYNEAAPAISADGLTLFMQSTRPGGYGQANIWVATRATVGDPWNLPLNVGPIVNGPIGAINPCISPDGLALFFTSARPGGYGGNDLYLARRAATQDPWGPPMNLGPIVNSQYHDITPSISADGSTLYFGSFRSGASDLWQAPIIRIVDFNGDGKVDGKDVLCMVSYWGTDDPLCDIGPFAWGDGTVDLQDLIVLAEYLGKEVSDPTLIGHWALDEAEGDYAHDSAGTNDAFVLGGPVWQPTGGQVDGAIQLDGVDDYIIAALALNPAKGPFSVLAWVKGGAPGQVVISEPTFANWLKADAEGKLITELQGLGRGGAPLQSQTNITDGQWHRIGFVWDGSRRMLVVDGIVAAEDTQDALAGSVNGLYIGCGKAMGAGTFWSGLIDDVRIYNRAVSP